MSEELRPCPFCGSKAVVEELGYDTLPGTFFQVRCEKCPAFVESSHRPSSVSVWNRRTADARVERMEKVVSAAGKVVHHFPAESSREYLSLRYELSKALASLTPEKAKSEGGK